MDMRARPKQKTLRLKIVVSLEEGLNSTYLTTTGTRSLFSTTHTHQLIALACQLLIDIVIKAMPLYLKYYHTGELPNEHLVNSYEHMRRETHERLRNDHA